MQHSWLVFALVALIFTVHSGHSIQCYQCYSETDKDCLDVTGTAPMECSIESYKNKFKEFFKQEPPKTLTSLNEQDNEQIRDLFTCMKFEINNGLQRMVLRACEVGKIVGTCDVVGSLYSGIDGISCNGCETDGCNSSSVPIPSIFYTFLVTIGAFALASLR